MTKFETGKCITLYTKDCGAQIWYEITSRTDKTIQLTGIPNQDDYENRDYVNVRIDTYTDKQTGEQTEGLSTKAIMKHWKYMCRPDDTIFAIAYDNRIEAYTTL